MLLTYRPDVHYSHNIYLESRIKGFHKRVYFTHVTHGHCSDDHMSLYMHEFTIKCDVQGGG